MSEVSTGLLVGGSLAFMILLGLVRHAELPIVHFAADTHECVQVQPVHAGDCRDLPVEYRYVWVER